MFNDSRDIASTLADLKAPGVELLSQTIDKILCFLFRMSAAETVIHIERLFDTIDQMV